MDSSSVKRRRGPVHIRRFGEIVGVLIKYGFGDILASLNIERYASIVKRFGPGKAGVRAARKVSRAERVRLALEELGPTFVKFGQFLSNRPDLLPTGLIEELEKLQDSVAPLPSDQVKPLIEEELGRPLSGVVAKFQEKPIASASIAQVHQATLHNGEEVAIKIQRPRIRERIFTDIDILFYLATLLERRYERIRTFRPTQLAAEFESVLFKEIDFTVEASHLGRFRDNFRNDRRIYVPHIYDYLSTKKLMVTEFVDGIKVSQIAALSEAGIDTRKVARDGAGLILTQIFRHGFFHADPHPGNILVCRDGRICFLDFGAVGVIPATLRYHLAVMLYGVVNKDVERIIRTLSQLSQKPIQDPGRLEYEILEFIEDYSQKPLRAVHVDEVLRRAAKILVDHDLSIIPGFYLLLKTLITIEGVGYRLDPDFNMVEQIEPHVKHLIRENPRMRHLPYDLYFTFLDLASLLKDLPFELKDIMRVTKSGALRIQFEHRNLEPLIAKSDELVNKLVFAIVVAALIIGSSLVVLSDVPPRFYDIPVIGIVGFVLAGLIGFGLLFSMIRHRKM